MTILVKQKTNLGVEYIFYNVKDVVVCKLFGSDNKCISHYYRLVDMSDEIHDELWETDKYDMYQKMEFSDNKVVSKNSD